MRSKKILGAVALLVIVSTMCGLAASAQAENTALCRAHEEPCHPSNLVESLHLINTAGTVGELLAFGGIELAVLCLNVLAQAEVLAPGSGAKELSQSIHAEELNFTNCGTNATHNNCTVNTALQLPSFELLKTALNLGTLEATSGKALVRCVIGGFIVIDCVYKGTGLSLTVEGALHKGPTTGHGMLTSNGTVLPIESGGGLCPEKSTIHGLLEPLTHAWIVS